MPTQKNITVYRDIFKRAFQIIRTNKLLWVFGFFAAFLGAGGELEPLMKDYVNISSTTDKIFSLQTLFNGGLLQVIYANVVDFFKNSPGQAALLILMMAVIVIVLIWLAIISQISLFDSVNRVTKNQKVVLKDTFQTSHKHFGPVLLINVLVKVALYALFIVITIPLMSWFILQSNAWGALLVILLVFLVFIPISIILSFVVKYAIAYIVIEGKTAGDAFRSGWRLFTKNWLVSIEMALIVLLVGLGVGLMIILMLGIAAIPFVLIGIAAVVFGSSAGFAATIAVGTIVWALLASFLGAIYVAYQYTAWTLLFQKLVEEKAQSKIVRLFSKLIPGRV
jgi:hypothetical protein